MPVSKIWRLRAFVVLVAIALGGCAVHTPDLAPLPVFPVPERFVMTGGDLPLLEGPWWEQFDDSRLNALVEQALAQNLDLAQGRARIARGQAFLQQSRALQRPQVGLGAGVRRSWERDLDMERGEQPTRLSNAVEAAEAIASLLEELGYDIQGGGGGGGGRQTSSPDPDTWRTDLSVGPSLSWELDLWGRLQSLTAADREELEALLHEQEALHLLLSAQLVETYFEALEQRLQLDLLMQQRTLAGTFLELLELRFLQGAASAVDLLQQRDQLAEIDSEAPVARSRLGVLENRLDVLTGLPPDGEDRTGGEVYPLPAPGDLPAITVPAALLQRRPDLRAAQRRVVAADYAIGVAMADRLPQVVLDGSFDFAHASGGGGARLAASMAARLFQPLLDWGLREARVSAAQAVLQQELLAFSRTYLIAIEEVETTLWMEARQRERIEALREREEILRRTVEEAQVRYSLGVTDYLPVITSLQQLQRVQRNLLDAQGELVRLRIQLSRAAGGATSSRFVESEQETPDQAVVAVRPLPLQIHDVDGEGRASQPSPQ